MKVLSVQARFDNSYAFRTGEWADIVGVVMVRPEGQEPRICYHLRFADGTCDYTPIKEPHDIRSVGTIE